MVCNYMCDLWRESGVSLYWRYARTWLASFRQHRWDLEEEAENLIRNKVKMIKVGCGYPDPYIRLPFHVVICGIA